jgi:hypothetical protein
MSFSKLSSSIVHSSLWTAEDHVRLLFLTLLAICDYEGFVYGSRHGLEHTAQIRYDVSKGDRNPWDVLMSPDPDSSDLLRNPQNEGRRIEAVDGGFRILNYLYYRSLRNDDDRREQSRRSKRNRRYGLKSTTKKASAKVSQCPPKSASVRTGQPCPPLSAHPDADADADTDTEADNSTNSTKGTNTLKSTTEGLSLKKERPRLSDEAFVESFARDNTYSGINVSREYGKMRRWCTVNKVQPTRRRFVNWLNRIEPPLRAKEHLVKIDSSTIDVPERFKAWVAERYPSKRAAAMNWQTWADVPSHGLREEWWKDEQGRLT